MAEKVKKWSTDYKCSFCPSSEIRVFCEWPGLYLKACVNEVCQVKLRLQQEEYAKFLNDRMNADKKALK